ncbi:MAG: FtsX-like permease family protein [Suipraeoptans sp.]
MLYKRIFRELKKEFFIYFSIAVIITLGLGTVLGGNAGDDSMIAEIEKYYDENNLENGSFSVLSKLTQDELNKLEDKNIIIEESTYYDVELQKTTLRIFENRENINIPKAEIGELPKDAESIFLEKHYAKHHEIEVDDSIEMGEKEYKVCGIGTIPDYLFVLQNVTDMMSNTDKFSVAILNEEGIRDIQEEASLIESSSIVYSFILPDNMSASSLKSYIEEETDIMMLSFQDGETNPRMWAYEDDFAMVKRATFVFAFIFLVLMAYIICVFTQNRVEKEREIIGTLYALGYKKYEITRYYLALPTLASLVGGVGSLLIGHFLFARMLTQDSINLYSVPDFVISTPIYIIAFGIIVPSLIMFLVGWIVLGHKLSGKPLQMIRGHAKQGWLLQLEMKGIGFINRYRIRQFIRELSANLVLIVGVFVATILLMLGVSIRGTITNYGDHVTNYVPYRYLNILATEPEKVPDDTEKIYVKNFKSFFSLANSDLDIIMFGIPNESDYFKFANECKEDKTIVISSAVAKKYGLGIGDEIELYSISNDKYYDFEISSVTNYTNGLHIFMNINSMSETFTDETSYSSALISYDKLKNKEQYNVISTIEASEYKSSTDTMLDSLYLFIIALVGSAAAIFILVIYLMLKFMVDKATFSISMLKIVGYHNKEVYKIYLGGELFTVYFAVAISIFLGRHIIELLLTFLTSGYSAYLTMHISNTDYIIMIAFIVIICTLTHIIHCRTINKVSYNEVLRNKE